MMYFSRARTALIVGVCALGVLLCLPNLFAQPAAWLPWHRVNLGLDLRGGSYLLMQVDMDTVVRERLEGLADEARDAAGAEAFDTAVRCYVDATAWTTATPADLALALADLPAATRVLVEAGALDEDDLPD